MTKALEILNSLREVTLENIKESCRVKLLRYISSRGSLDNERQFTPSLITTMFRDTTLTRRKIAAMTDLMRQIESAKSLDELTEMQHDFLRAKNELSSSKFTSGLERTIGKCLVMLELASRKPAESASLDEASLKSSNDNSR